LLILSASARSFGAGFAKSNFNDLAEATKISNMFHLKTYTYCCWKYPTEPEEQLMLDAYLPLAKQQENLLLVCSPITTTVSAAR